MVRTYRSKNNTYLFVLFILNLLNIRIISKFSTFFSAYKNMFEKYCVLSKVSTRKLNELIFNIF